MLDFWVEVKHFLQKFPGGSIRRCNSFLQLSMHMFRVKICCLSQRRPKALSTKKIVRAMVMVPSDREPCNFGDVTT